jgi:hypothetical protein
VGVIVVLAVVLPAAFDADLEVGALPQGPMLTARARDEVGERDGTGIFGRHT